MELIERLRKTAQDICGSPLEEVAPLNALLNEAADRLKTLEEWAEGPNGVRWYLNRNAALQQQLGEAREALRPSGDTKAAYHGEFHFNIPQAQEDENGEPIEVSHRVYVPWTTVKEIMAAISARAFGGLQE